MYRISELIQLDKKIYHTGDLAVLWRLSNRNTLYTAIKRYVQKGVLFPIYKGLYATVPVSTLSPLELGKAILHNYTYLTTESVLAQAGVISQVIYAHTFAAGQSKKVSLGGMQFFYRQLKPEYLHHPAGILNQHGNYIASLERAAADMLYFNPHYYFDIPEGIDFLRVREIQQEVGYPCR